MPRNSAKKVIDNFGAIGVVPGNPQVRQRGGQGLGVNSDHIMGWFGDDTVTPQLSGMFLSAAGYRDISSPSGALGMGEEEGGQGQQPLLLDIAGV